VWVWGLGGVGGGGGGSLGGRMLVAVVTANGQAEGNWGSALVVSDFAFEKKGHVLVSSYKQTSGGKQEGKGALPELCSKLSRGLVFGHRRRAICSCASHFLLGGRGLMSLRLNE